MNQVYVSGLAFTTREDLPTLERVYVLFSNICRDNGFVFIDNRNIKGDCLYQGGLHLLDTESYRKILIKEGNIGFVSSGFEALRENRLKYVSNLLISYLNTNSLRNKIVNLREIILQLSLD